MSTVVMEVKHSGKKKENYGTTMMEILSNPFITEDIRKTSVSHNSLS